MLASLSEVSGSVWNLTTSSDPEPDELVLESEKSESYRKQSYSHNDTERDVDNLAQGFLWDFMKTRRTGVCVDR